MNMTQKIAKLLRKAEGASTPQEAEAYSAKAERLMLEHSVDAAMIAAAEDHPSEKIVTRSFTLGTYAKPKATLLGGIAQAFGAHAFTVGGKSNRVVVHGWESDLETIAVLFESLERQAMSAAAYAHRERPWVHGKTFTTSFLVGFAGTVFRRLLAQKRTVEHEVEERTTGTALVLVDRKAAVERHVTELNRGKRVGKASASQVSSAAGYRTGQAAGERADLGGTRLGTARRAALA